MGRRKRFNIKKILENPNARRDFICQSIVFTQSIAGINTTLEQAYAAYDKVQEEKENESVDGCGV
jgi:hypothetical protein